MTKIDGYVTGRVRKTDVDKYNIQIVSREVNQWKMTDNLRIFWPASVYKRLKKTKNKYSVGEADQSEGGGQTTARHCFV